MKFLIYSEKKFVYGKYLHTYVDAPVIPVPIFIIGSYFNYLCNNSAYCSQLLVHLSPKYYGISEVV